MHHYYYYYYYYYYLGEHIRDHEMDRTRGTTGGEE
jgi:hypothetical protein